MINFKKKVYSLRKTVGQLIADNLGSEYKMESTRYAMLKKSNLLHLPPLDQKISIRELIANRSAKYADKTFLIDAETGKEYSYAQFARIVNSVSNYLWKLGVHQGDKVALMMPNSAEFLFSYFGVMQTGAIACPININLKPEEVAYILDNSDSIAVFTSKECMDVTIRALHKQEKVRHLLNWTFLTGIGEDISPIQLIDVSMAISQEPEVLSPDIASIPVEPDDVAEMIYTSGTTGKPKGVLLTHHNLIIDSHWISHWNRLQASDRALCVMPLFHVNGQVVTVLTPLYCGGSVVLPNKFSVMKFFSTINKYHVTYTGTVATMLSMLLNRVDGQEISLESLRIVFCGSAPVPEKVQKEFEKTFGVPVIEGFGMTETACRSTFNPLPTPDKLKLGENDGFRKIGSVGLPLGNEMRIADENDNPLGPNEVGEIVIRGENVMKGYYNNPEATAEAFRGGWFHSGDVGYYDIDGYFYVIDRKKDMIIRGGENIYPREIEEVLYKHPAVKDAACIGIADELYSEEVAAFVVPKEGQRVEETDLISFCQQHLANFKCPKQIKIVAEIPKGPSGKLLRRELREKWGVAP